MTATAFLALGVVALAVRAVEELRARRERQLSAALAEDLADQGLPKGAWAKCGACGQEVVNSHKGWQTHLPFCPAYLPTEQVVATIYERSGRLVLRRRRA